MPEPGTFLVWPVFNWEGYHWETELQVPGSRVPRWNSGRSIQNPESGSAFCILCPAFWILSPTTPLFSTPPATSGCPRKHTNQHEMPKGTEEPPRISRIARMGSDHGHRRTVATKKLKTHRTKADFPITPALQYSILPPLCPSATSA